MTSGGPARKVFTIPAGLAFADVLAGHLLARAEHDPLKLAEMVVLLPNRRACRTLEQAFLRASGGRPLLLPRLKPIEPDEADEDILTLLGEGDPDLPEPVPPTERLLILTRLVLGAGAARGGRPPSPDQAARLAAELGKLLDGAAIERVGFDRLGQLVPDELAAHWQVTLDFLKIVTEHWPALLGGRLDHQTRVNRVLDAQAAHWRANPPDHPVIAAGSTGSRPATLDLLATIAGLPQGMVVLPGLDKGLDEESWAALDETHPQFMLARLLKVLGLTRKQVGELTATPDPRAARLALLSQALRPAATCEAWKDLPEFPAATLAGISRLDAPSPREEAGAIALMLRETLEQDGRTAALVTPDRDLARRVAAELERWGILIDDSAGRPLALTEPGAFLRLLAEMVADHFAPHAVLACLKHPLAAGPDFRHQVRRLDRLCLRGPRPAAGIAGLRLAVGGDAALVRWLDGLQAALAPFLAVMGRDQASLGELLAAHMEAAEALAGPERLWRGEAGEALGRFAGQLAEAAAAVGTVFPAIAPASYPALFDQLLTGQVVRPRWGRHPRLSILGPMEARLQQADLMILAGLNEGTWPAIADADPWMSRPMRAKFGLPAPERRIGQAAHDFAQGFGAARVVLTRSVRVEGAPTVPSRWLMRLDAVAQAAGLSFDAESAGWLAWHDGLDHPRARAPVERPAPRPPVAARPRKLSVTEIETWMRDPYALYAKHVLGLRKLDPIDADPGAADYGSLVHKAIETFLKAHPSGPLPLDSLARLEAIGADIFAAALARPGLWAFWWPRFTAIAAWLVEHEQARRADIAATFSEVKGGIEIVAPGGPFLLHARADRIDRLKDGTLAVIDYKTGQPPSAKEVAAGYAPQLSLEAAIARFGGFDGVAPAPVGQMLFWRLKGGSPGGEEKKAGDDPASLADQALDGLAALVAAFDDPATPYEARPHPDRAPRFSDTNHLARLQEWASAGEDDE
ncbi:Inactivated superfamily I helicase [Magnetospirillum sp. LM-5]|uniref:double-strand break repair protein AddB n=1 Tax=Magnetospirillum sp. LM-5 TaxID=2681466 RepID=UPI001381FBC9|nr:double-strand break repair protein AddB [Magnetospirillum sp. LM-5]CAA7618618.1 Inactivated superfamily I helicase [Magnetospirillum sp. LM-5]